MTSSPNLKKTINNSFGASQRILRFWRERAKFQLDPFLKQVLVGNILGDVFCLSSKISPKAKVRLVFRQGSVYSSYLLMLLASLGSEGV